MEPLFDAARINGIKEILAGRQETLAVAESVTAGLLQAAMASAVEASRFFQGGITVYNLGQKYRHLLIDPIHAAGCNCVSQRVAEEMALHVCTLFSSEWGLGITGYASPVPESGNKLFVYYAISYKGKIAIAERMDAEADEPLRVQLAYVARVAERLHSAVSDVK